MSAVAGRLLYANIARVRQKKKNDPRPVQNRRLQKRSTGFQRPFFMRVTTSLSDFLTFPFVEFGTWSVYFNILPPLKRTRPRNVCAYIHRRAFG